jgi:hypothetical protein
MFCYFSSDDGEAAASKNWKKRKNDNQTASLKAELKQLLSQPLLAKGVSAKYLTSGTKDVVTALLSTKGIQSSFCIRSHSFKPRVFAMFTLYLFL